MNKLFKISIVFIAAAILTYLYPLTVFAKLIYDKILDEADYVSQYNKYSVETDKINYTSSKTGRIYYKDKAVVLTYHHISVKPFSGITIKPERFEADLKMLRDNEFNVISLRQLIDAMEGKRSLPPNAVVITFDDGLESFYTYAYPLLEKYKMPAVNFIITSRTESYNSFSKDLKPLKPEEIKEMYQSGLVDIGSHTHNSHDFVYINSELKQGSKLAFRIYDRKKGKLESEEEYAKRVSNDLNMSREIIYKYIGKYPDMLCFPFGHYGSRSMKVAKSCGFKYFITTQYGYNSTNSKSIIINRIRAGDYNLTTEKLMKNIIACANSDKKSKDRTNRGVQ